MKAIRLFSAVLLCMSGLSWSQSAKHDVYPDPSQAKADIAAAIKAAPQAHKRVLILFGANWCPNCVALDKAMQGESYKSMLEPSYLLVHANVGEMSAMGTRNELAESYKLDLSKGIPAAVVLNEKGDLLFSGPLAEIRKPVVEAEFTAFLKKWKP
jgi:thioredoxin 1